MRVLVVSNLFPPHSFGGAELSAFNTCLGLSERGIDVSALMVNSSLPLRTDARHKVRGISVHERTVVKLPFGHHGGNHPVRELASGRVLITSQNHNYAVEESSLPREVEVTHINLTDGTVEGLSLPRELVESSKALCGYRLSVPGINVVVHGNLEDLR